SAPRALRGGAARRQGRDRPRGHHESRRADRPAVMKIAVLGPGGVGGLVAAALEQAGNEVVVVAQEPTVAVIAEQGLVVESVKFGELVSCPRAVAALQEPVDALLVATKAAGLSAALERIETAPTLVLPLLNGLDHIAVLRERFAPESVLAGAIRVEADRPRPGVVVHTSPFLLVTMASAAAVAVAEGAAEVDVAATLAEVARIPDTFGTSMQRDIAAGREPELDAIPGSVLRAAARHGIPCPTIERLVSMIAARIHVPPPIPDSPA